MRSARFLCGVAVGALLLLGAHGLVAAVAADGDGYPSPRPPYDAPAAVVTLTWDYPDDVVVLYKATTSRDPVGRWTDGAFAGWGGGCRSGAVTGGEALPLFLGGGPNEAYYDELAVAPGHGVYNWSEEPGTYTIVAGANGYCVNPGAGGSDRANEMYESVLPPGRTFTVTARVERFEAGSASPAEVRTFSAAVPMQLSSVTNTVIGQVTVDPPAEQTAPTGEDPAGGPAVPSAAEGASPEGTADDDPNLLRWFLDPMVWLVAAMLLGVAVMVGIYRAVLRGLRGWTPTHAVARGTAMTEVHGPDNATSSPLAWGQIPGGVQQVTADSSVRLVREVPGTDDVVVEFRDGTQARTPRQTLEPLRSAAAFRPSHRLVGDRIPGWAEEHDPGCDAADSCLPSGDDLPVEVLRSTGQYTLVRYGTGGRTRMWVPADRVTPRTRPSAAGRGPAPGA